MQTLQNVHQQFATFFKSEVLKPYAYLVSKKLSEGHICIRVDEAADELIDSPYHDFVTIPNHWKRLHSEPLVMDLDGRKQPFVLHNKRLYLQRYFEYETRILKRIRAFVAGENQEREKRITEIRSKKELVQGLFGGEAFGPGGTPAENIDWQLAAAVMAIINNFTIITGGPGTGKTTTVARIIAILYAIQPQLRVALAAPTGKAAVRMAESLQSASLNVPAEIVEKFASLVPGTIHRLLKYIPNSPYFKHNKDNPVNFDVVIIDESSMIDVALFAKLLDAIGPQTRLILLGDKDQLASVEAGSLFGDLCKAPAASNSIVADTLYLINSLIRDPRQHVSEEFIAAAGFRLMTGHIIELKRSRRFSSDAGIGRFSKAIIKNDRTLLVEYIKANDDKEVRIDTTYDPAIFERFVEGYADYIQESDVSRAIKKLNGLRVLCAVREGEQGLYSLNAAIENYLRKKRLITKTSENYENRPIIVTRNYYSLGLYNGDVGIIRADSNGVLKAWFEDSNNELKSVFPGYVAESETVYAMTIHKSQGSEYDRVLVVLPNNPDIPILTRELLYTGVTRARTHVTVQAGEAVLFQTAEGVVERASGILERFEE